MHFEILVEDLSGKTALDILFPKIVGYQHSFRIIGYRGIGRIPKNLVSGADVLNRYQNDSICGTWELLADAIHSGGSIGLKKKGWQAIGREKSAWSQKIAPQMDVKNNASPSFCYFQKKIRELIRVSMMNL